MSDVPTSLPVFRVYEGDRQSAVNAALELLRGYCLGGNATRTGEIDELFAKLPQYADKILEAARTSGES